MGAAERGYPRPELPSVAAGAVSSAGRAPALHAGGRRFESCTAHFAVNSPVGLAQPCLAPHAIDVGHAIWRCPRCRPRELRRSARSPTRTFLRRASRCGRAACTRGWASALPTAPNRSRRGCVTRAPTRAAKRPVPLGLVLPLPPPLDQRRDASPGEHEHQHDDRGRRDEQIREGQSGMDDTAAPTARR